MLGYVASCLGLALSDPQPIAPSAARSSSRSPDKQQSAAAASAAAAFAAAAAVKPSPSELDRVTVLDSGSTDTIIRATDKVVKPVKRPSRVFISRRSAHKSEFFINFNTKRDKERAFCLSEGHLPFRLSPLDRLPSATKQKRHKSDTMNQRQMGCDIARTRTSTRRNASRSPACYFCEADAYASLAAAGWTCTTTESTIPPPDQVRYMYQMPYLPQTQSYPQSYQPYPMEFEGQYMEFAQAASPAFISYSPSPRPIQRAKLGPIQSPRNVAPCSPCPPCPPCQSCPISPQKTRRSPPKTSPYDRGLCESAEMGTQFISEPGSSGRSRSRNSKKSSRNYYETPFENSSHFPSRIPEDDEFEDERWTTRRQQPHRNWKEQETSETEKSSTSSLWNRIPMTTSEETSNFSRKSPSQSARRNRNIEISTQTSVNFSKEFLPEAETEPLTVATQTSLPVLVLNRKDQAGGDIAKLLEKDKINRQETQSAPIRQSSPVTSPRRAVTPFSDALNPVHASLPGVGISEMSDYSTPLIQETLTDVVPSESDEQSVIPFVQEEEGSTGNLEAGRDVSPISFSTTSGSIRDYATPPPFAPDEKPDSPSMLGELSTELQALAVRVAVLEHNRCGSSGTFIPEIVDICSRPEGIEPIATWYERATSEVHTNSEEETIDDDEEISEDLSETDFAIRETPGNASHRIRQHTCSFSDIEDADWNAGILDSVSDCRSSNNAGSVPPPEMKLIASSPREPTSGWCNSNVGIARSSPNLRSSSRPSGKTPTMSTSNEEYVSHHEPEVVKLRNGGMVAVQSLPIHSFGITSSHWKKINMDVGLGDWDHVMTSLATNGESGDIIDEQKNGVETTNKQAGEGGENYNPSVMPPPPSPLPSPELAIGDGACLDLPSNIQTESEMHMKEINLTEELREKIVEEEKKEKEKIVENEDDEKCLDENSSSRGHSSTPFLLDSILFPPAKPSPAGTPLFPSMENLRKRCNVDVALQKDSVEKASSSTQTLMKTSLDSDQLQLFSAFQRVVALGESKLDEGLGLVDHVAIEIDLCRLEAITHIAYVVVVVCLFLLLTALLSFIAN